MENSPQLPRILILEDEKSHQLLIAKALSTSFHLIFCSSIAEASQLLKDDSYRLFLLDVMLPDGSGFDFCQTIRADVRYKFTPILFLTSKMDIESKVVGFSIGGDDYITKPCDPVELRARVVARIQKEACRESTTEALTAYDLSLNLEKQRVTIIDGADAGMSIDLTPLEFKLLVHLVRHENTPVSRGAILQSVWGQQTHVLERSVDTYVAALRRKLGSRGKYIRSVHGLGYRFSPGTSLRKKVS